MSLRHVKPQSALIATTRTQIGSIPMLGISIGIGFRLSEPSVLVHEAAVWEALKAAAPSSPIFEPAMPKLRAEWLLAGRSAYRAPSGTQGRMLDWTAHAELDGVGKTVSCRARAEASNSADIMAYLPIDAAHAVAGSARENPLGVTAGDAPLQRVGALGVKPAPLASMGALGQDWPERRQWQPARPGSIEAMAEDGSHLGWPAAVDLRLFQQAAPDQWSDQASWPPGARYVLAGFGPYGDGYTGTLPQLDAVALLTYTDQPDFDQPELRQQTVWLLPDHDIGVMWWQGAAQTRYLLDDRPAMLVAAFKDRHETVDATALMAFAQARADVSNTDPTQQADHALMPSVARGWVWELILEADDHPRFAPPRRSHMDLQTRLERHQRGLGEAHEAESRLHTFKESIEHAALPPVPCGTEDWRTRFGLETDDAPRQLTRETIRDADLSDLTLDGWHFDEVRFERCVFDRTVWRRCELSNVQAVECSFVDSTFDTLIWKSGTITRSKLLHALWRDVRLERVHLDACQIDHLSVKDGAWSLVSLQGCRGARGGIEGTHWQGVSWNQVDAGQWTWTHIQADSLSLVECSMTDLTLSQCTLAKPSVLLSNLSASVWQRNTLTFAVLSHGTSIDRARFSDCLFKSSSLLNLRADAIQVDYCSFSQLTARHLKASRSSWAHSLLDGANVTHADLVGATFERCSLKEAMLYGADMRESRLHDCNLVRARTSWVNLPEAGAWRGNLDAGHIALPRRKQ